MNVAALLAVLAAVAFSEAAADGPVADGAARLVLATCAMALVVLLAASISLRSTRGLRCDSPGHVRRQRQRFRALRRAHALLYLVAALAILGGLSWPRLVRFNWGLDGWFLADELLILAPAVAPFLLSQIVFGFVEQAAYAPPRRGRFSQAGIAWRAWGRHFALFAMPVFIVLAVSDFSEWLLPASNAALAQGLILISSLGLIVLAQPLLMRFAWRAEPLVAGDLRRRVYLAAGTAGICASQILVWRTGGRIANAVLAGLVPGLRYLFLTDALLARLTAGELEMVLRHEAAHIQRRHVLLRLLAVVAPVSWWLAARVALPQASEWMADTVATLGVGQAAPALFAGGFFAAYAFVALGVCSRLLEHDADLWACGFGGRGEPAATRSQRADRLAAALLKLALTPGEIDRRTWLHPSIARRIDLLEQAAAGDSSAQKLRRRVSLLRLALMGTLAAPLLILLWRV